MEFAQAIKEIVRRALQNASSQVINDIIKFLKDNPGRSFTSRQVAESIKRPNPSVRRYISPLGDLGAITRVGKKRQRGVKYTYGEPDYVRKLVKVEIYCGSSSENAEAITYEIPSAPPENPQDPDREKELVNELLLQLQKNGKGNCIIRKDQSGHLIRSGEYNKKGKELYGVYISELTAFTDFETIDFGYDDSQIVEKNEADYIYPDIKTVIN
jgi:hypothetical protein